MFLKFKRKCLPIHLACERFASLLFMQGYFIFYNGIQSLTNNKTNLNCMLEAVTLFGRTIAEQVLFKQVIITTILYSLHKKSNK